MQNSAHNCETCHLAWLENGNSEGICPRCSAKAVLRQMFAEFIDVAKKHPDSINLQKIDSFAIKIAKAGCYPWDWEEYREFLKSC